MMKKREGDNAGGRENFWMTICAVAVAATFIGAMHIAAPFQGKAKAASCSTYGGCTLSAPSVTCDAYGWCTGQKDQYVESNPDPECVGACGKKCDGLMGTLQYTSTCLEHDNCVDNYGHLACLAGIIPAGVSWISSMFGLDGVTRWVTQPLASLATAVAKFVNKVTSALKSLLSGW